MLPNDDLRIAEIKELLPPIALLERFPADKKSQKTVANARQEIHNIISNKSNKLLVIIGPCSIHDTKAAIEYAQKLLHLREKYKDQLEIIMRVYFEKPRTTVGWKGLLNDPYLDGTYDMNQGLRIARKLLLDLTNIGMPTAVEFLDMISPQYIADLISWGAIGARTTESQVHRQLASGMSCPIGFKNGTNGNIQIAVDAIGSSKAEHHFLSVTKFGHSAIVNTKGNEDSHIILRGGKVPNYSKEYVKEVEKLLEKNNLPKKIMIDCSHANSNKKHERQLVVAKDIHNQLKNGNKSIFGVMIESHLFEGKQSFSDKKNLKYGQSITDACIGWNDTEEILKIFNDAIIAHNKI